MDSVSKNNTADLWTNFSNQQM